MDVSGLGSSPLSAKNAKNTTQLAETFDQFLTLLVTQLKHQDPLAPMDANEFVSQLVQFTEVEQSLATNTKLDELLALESGNEAVAALGYIGRDVEVKGDASALTDGTANYTYTLDGSATTASLAILDQSDRVVFVGSANTTAGTHAFAWNGLDNNGQPVPASGTYRIRVSALKADGGAVPVTHTVIARVTGVETSADGVMLRLGTVEVAARDVLSVREKTAPPPS